MRLDHENQKERQIIKKAALDIKGLYLIPTHARIARLINGAIYVRIIRMDCYYDLNWKPSIQIYVSVAP